MGISELNFLGAGYVLMFSLLKATCLAFLALSFVMIYKLVNNVDEDHCVAER